MHTCLKAPRKPLVVLCVRFYRHQENPFSYAFVFKGIHKTPFYFGAIIENPHNTEINKRLIQVFEINVSQVNMH
jgi:hypothetical protein